MDQMVQKTKPKDISDLRCLVVDAWSKIDMDEVKNLLTAGKKSSKCVSNKKVIGSNTCYEAIIPFIFLCLHSTDCQCAGCFFFFLNVLAYFCID